MKNSTLLLFLSLYCFFSCDSKTKHEVEHLSIHPTVLVPDLEITLPGSFYVMDSLVFVEAVRSNMEQVYVYSLNDRRLKAKICNNGHAVNELIQVSLIPESDSVMIAYDLNGKGIYYSARDLNVLEVKNDLGLDFDVRCRITPTSYVKTNDNPLEKEWFVYHANGIESKFGEFPLAKDYKDWSILVRGTMHYVERDSMLHFFSVMLPYAAKYKLKNDGFVLESENYYGKYTITKNEAGFSKIERDNFDFSNLVFTKNYIVNLTYVAEKEEATTSKSEGWDLPGHLYLYDYDYNLLKIIDMGTKALRVSSEGANSDVVYLISVEEGLYNISKVVL